MADTVDLIDPIESISSLPNGTPNYEDLFIFAELLGERRERSVLTMSANQGKTTLQTQLSNTNVNMLGVDHNPDVKGSATFTTNWTNNEGSSKNLEGFGVSNIEVKINSSFIPVVNIEFVDIRGLTFFNHGENSPYGLLFDFPPPIFKMTLKGYYGKSLDYDLHLVKHNTRFDSKSGNYYINVEFVARTFAPLADVPFKFAELISIMEKGTIQPTDPKTNESAMPNTDNITPPTIQEDLNFDPRVAPRNTYELVAKLKRLTDELKNIKDTSKEGVEFDQASEAVTQGKRIETFMNDFSGEIGTAFQKSSKIVIKNTGTDSNNNTSDNSGDFDIVGSVQTYNDTIQSSNTSGNDAKTQKTKIYLAILEKINREDNILDTDTEASVISKDSIISALNKYKNELEILGTNFSEENIPAGSIGKPTTIYDNNPEGTTNEKDNDQYQALDVTNFYIALEKTITSKQDIADNKQTELVEIINSEVKKILGFKPSIYNIFKVLCDDVDSFYKKIGKVSAEAESHHNVKKNFNQIIDRVEEKKSKDVTKTLYPFPLFTKEEITCGVTRKTRRMPEKENFGLDVEFPEVNFIDEFIDTMIRIKKEEDVDDMRTQIGGNGNLKWLPITPADSSLNLGLSYDSPYANLSSGQNEENYLNEFYYRLINRFYIASQFTYGNSFYSTEEKSGFIHWGTTELKRNDLIEYIAKSEAINVANSIINDNVLNSLIQKAPEFAKDSDLFYDTIKDFEFYNSIPDNVLLLTDGETDLYNDRNETGFVGMNIIMEAPNKRIDGSVDNNSPIELFLNKESGYLRSISNWFSPNDKSKIQSFTQENITYFSDSDDNNPYITRYINEFEDDDVLVNLAHNLSDSRNTLREIANSETDYVKSFSNIIAKYYKEINNFTTGTTYSNQTKAFVYASLFGTARSYFSLNGWTSITGGDNIGNVNNRFLMPAVVEVPRFSIYYMGGLIDYNTSGTTYDDIQELLDENITENNWFRDISRGGIHINDDAPRVKKLSSEDKKTFTDKYNFWSSPSNELTQFFEFKNELKSLLGFVIGLDPDIRDDVDKIEDEIENSIDRGEYMNLSIREDFLLSASILNFSEYTFQNAVTPVPKPPYDPLEITRDDDVGVKESRSAANDTFFNAFWGRLRKELPKRAKELKKVEDDFNGSIADEDIKTQLYYTFKNINDKWVSGSEGVADKGFPLNNGIGDPLISKFAFVDRAMNPIGDDVIIGAESLIEMSQDYDLNMFQVFSRLLSLNGFEFFPLQNFMSFNNKDGKWADAFKPNTTLDQKQTPAFVCMYIGGTSSTLENSSSQFDNDGILDLNETGLPDFHNVKDCNESQEVKDSKNRTRDTGEAEFKYSEPKAFRVRFAEQNQSFFTSIKLEGREFPETADSLAILSRIAGDGTTAPVSKGQNLFSVYENRAYSVTVTMLGNVMIQPTQYFQLENIPMYSGAYMILSVKHTVKANHMVTEFQGVKVLKFPNPFVKNFATLVGIESGTSEDLSGNRSVGDAISARTLPFKGNEKDGSPYNNEMFSLKMSP